MATAPDPATDPEPLEVIAAAEAGVAAPDPDAPDTWVVLGEDRWPLRVDAISARHSRLLRVATGLPVSQWVTAATTEVPPDPDTIAVLAWLARVQNGEPDLAFETVEATVTAGMERRLANTDAYAEDADSPEG